MLMSLFHFHGECARCFFLMDLGLNLVSDKLFPVDCQLVIFFNL